MTIASIGYLAIAIDKAGGAKKYEECLWKQLAFITRYGHQSLEDALELEDDDRNSYMDALAELISEENKSGRSLTNTGG